MIRGEYESAKEIYKVAPTFLPRPLACGRYKVGTPTTWFYMAEFVDMDVSTAPDPDELARKLAELHWKSESPDGKYGFHAVTCDGRMPHTVDWQDTWSKFFVNLLLGVYRLDLETNGPWEEFERAMDQVVNKVVPRLLDNLRFEGKPIKPCILHGDVWEMNMGVNMETGELVLYDVSSYYAHNEMELGQFRADFCTHLRSKAYVRSYLSYYPAADPVEEFDDRNRLYSLKSLLNYSAGHPGSMLRKTIYNHMCYLCEKFAPLEGIDKYDPWKDSSATGTRLMSESAEDC